MSNAFRGWTAQAPGKDFSARRRPASGRRHIGGLPRRALRSSTEAYALVKARAIRERLGTTWGLSETGATGPTGNRYGNAAGHACIAVVGPVERAITVETAKPDREANMWVFTRAALELLERCFKEATSATR